MLLLACAVVQAAWFWPAAQEPSVAGVSSTGEVAQSKADHAADSSPRLRVDAAGLPGSLLETASRYPSYDQDQTAEFGELSEQITKASSDDAMANKKLEGTVHDALAGVNGLKVDLDNAVEKTVLEAQTIDSAGQNIGATLEHARTDAQGVVDLGISATGEMKENADMLQKQAANAIVSMTTQANSFTSQMNNDAGVHMMETEQILNRDMNSIQSTENRVDVASKANQEKAETTVKNVENKMTDLNEQLEDQITPLKSQISDLQKLMKKQSKDVADGFDDAMKDIRTDIALKDPVDVKATEKLIEDAGGEVEDAAEQGIKEMEDKASKLEKENALYRKTFEKDGDAKLKELTRDAERKAGVRENTINNEMKTIKAGIDDSQLLADSIKRDILDDVDRKAQGLRENLATETMRAAKQQNAMLQQTSEQGDQAVKAVQGGAEALKSEQDAATSQQATAMRSEAFVDLQTTEKLARDTAMDINAKTAEVSSKVANANNGVKAADQSSQEVQSLLDAAKVQATQETLRVMKKATKAEQDMRNEQKVSEQNIKIKVHSKKGEFDSRVNQMVAAMNTLAQKLPQSVVPSIEKTKRNFNSQLQTEESQMDGDTSRMGSRLSQLKSKVLEVADGLTEPQVQQLLEGIMHKLSQFGPQKEELKKEVGRMGDVVTTKTRIAVQKLDAEARKAKADFMNENLRRIREFETKQFTALGEKFKNADQTSSRAEQNGQRNMASNEYIEQQIAELQNAADTFKKTHEEFASKEKAEMAKQGIAQEEFKRMVAETLSNVQATSQHTLAHGEEGFEELLTQFGTNFRDDEKKFSQSTESKIAEAIAKIMQTMQDAEDGDQQKIQGVDSRSAQVMSNTQQVLEALKGTADEAKRVATEADQDAQLSQDKMSAAINNADKVEQDLAAQVESETNEAIKSSKDAWQGKIDALGRKMNEKLKALQQSAGQSKFDTDRVLDDTKSGYKTMQERVHQTVQGVSDKADSLRNDMLKYSQNVDEAVSEDGNQNTEDDALFRAGLEKAGQKFSSEEMRQMELVKILQQSSIDVRHSSDDELATLLAQLDARSKANQGELEASYAQADITAETAQHSLEGSELDLNAARQELVTQMNNVQSELDSKAGETDHAIKAFETGIATERDMLEKNVAYLRAYDLTVQSQVLGLLEKASETIGITAERAATGFKEVETKEQAISASVGSLLEGEAYTTLQRIMDADQYVQRAAVENQELTQYMENFKTDQERYMKALIQSLYDAQYAMLLHDAHTRAEQEGIDEEASALTNSVIGGLTRLVNGNATDEEAAQLEKMTASTLQMLLAKAASGTEHDKAQLALLKKKIEQHGTGGFAHLDNAQTLIDSINNAVNGDGNYEAMKADLERVVAFNTKLVDDQRKAMQARGKALSDHLFFGDDAGFGQIKDVSGFDHVPLWKKNEYKNQAVDIVDKSYSRDAFLERQRKYVDDSTAAARAALLKATPKTPEEKQRWQQMNALLEKNTRLMAENKQLSQQHAEIGASIQGVTQQLRSGAGSKHAQPL